SVAELAATDTDRRATRLAAPASIRPSPHRVSPGSMPRISTLLLRGGQHLVRGVEVGEDVLHVITVFERVDEAQHLTGAVDVNLDLHGRHPGRLRAVVVDASVLEGRANRHEVRCLGEDL